VIEEETALAAIATATTAASAAPPAAAAAAPAGAADFDPAMRDPLVNCSGKIVFLHKLLVKLRGERSKALVFSQFTTTLDVIQEYLRAYGFSYERIDGGVSGHLRSAAITRFNAPDSTTDVFLLTTRAGGLGLNLQAANHVVIFDSDWNPQGDLQAIARAHRLGQTKEVKVFRLLTKHTAEEAMFKVATHKLGLTDVLLNGLHKGGRGGAGAERPIDEILRMGASELLRMDDATTADLADKFMGEDIDRILQVTR
jgi:chromodomain-helicase-DNA-binding protein 7